LSNIHLVIGDQHAHYGNTNERADWLSRLIIDVRPDVVVNIGDAADLPSLSGFDKGKRAFQGRTYEKDIACHLDFQDRLWSPVLQRKKRLPRRVFLHGNHEHRIWSAINTQPELEGTVSFADLQLNRWYDDIVPYSGNSPGTVEIDGVTYAHFFTSGIAGRPVSSENLGAAMLSKNFSSCTSGHSHLFDISIRTRSDGGKIQGCSVGCFQDYTNDWAGEIGKLWDRGILIKRNVQQGAYDFQWVSLASLKKEYSK